jgi:hypothetical protein
VIDPRRPYLQAYLALAFALLLSACVGSRSSSRSENLDPSQFGFDLMPEVRRTIDLGGWNAHMALNYLRYAKALGQGGDALDEVVAPDVKLNDLERMGFEGLSGLKEFRKQRNSERDAVAPSRPAVVVSMNFPSPDITEVVLCGARNIVHARDRWVNDKVVERWHRLESPPAGGCPVPATQK